MRLIKVLYRTIAQSGESPSPPKIFFLELLKNHVFKLNHLSLNSIPNDSPPNSKGFMSLSIIVSEKNRSNTQTLYFISIGYRKYLSIKIACLSASKDYIFVLKCLDNG